ncbi:MAG TPA: SPFH domain-containing protein [Polyangiaceae bacterium]|nr:SPFH domain-containing protein [Polyangiaceae bacterium]
MSPEFQSFPMWLALSPLALFALVLLYKSVAVVKGTEIAVLERRWFGRPMPEGRVVAMRNEIGVQAHILGPGLHLLTPFIYSIELRSMLTIKEDEIGLIEAVDGRPIAAGRIFANVVSGHDLFQDGESFLNNGGERGPQLEIIPPGIYRINPYLFKITKAPAVSIPPGSVGVVGAIDGEPIPAGRLLARSVGPLDNFQNAQAFLAAGGQKGPQIDILLPGQYRINTKLFTIDVRPATVVPVKKVGIVTAKDGEPLPPSEYVAKLVNGHRDFQDAAAFLGAGGQRGPQLGFLRPGTYYVNPAMFDVASDSVAEVERGHVAVIVSNVGLEPVGVVDTERASESGPLVVGIERYVVDAGYRGIQREVAGPGTYYLNRLAYIPHIIPTTNITIDWADDGQSQHRSRAFDPLAIVSKDGFEMTISVKVIFRVLPEQAPHMVARIGTIDNLIEHVIHPLIDSSFRNQASSTEAMKFMQDRHEEQRKAETHTGRELAKYHVTCVSVLICQIILPERLMDTLTNKVVAAQQMSMFDAQQQAEERRREMANTKAQADLRPELVKAEVDVQIATQRKQEAVLLAEGRGMSTRVEQEGVAAGIAAVGQAEGEKIRAIGLATAEAYEQQASALGQSQLAMVEIMKRIADGKIRITPDVLVSSGESGGADNGSGIMAAFVANLLAREVRG